MAFLPDTILLFVRRNENKKSTNALLLTFQHRLHQPTQLYQHNTITFLTMGADQSTAAAGASGGDPPLNLAGRAPATKAAAVPVGGGQPAAKVQPTTTGTQKRPMATVGTASPPPVASSPSPSVPPASASTHTTANNAAPTNTTKEKQHRVNPVTVAMEQQAAKRAEMAAKAQSAKEMIREQRELEKMEKQMAKDKIKHQREEEKRIKAEAKAIKDREREAARKLREERRAALEALEQQQQQQQQQRAANNNNNSSSGGGGGGGDADEECDPDVEMQKALAQARAMLAQTYAMEASMGGDEDGGTDLAPKRKVVTAQQQRVGAQPATAQEVIASVGGGTAAALPRDDDDNDSVAASSVKSADYRDEDLMHDFNTLVVGPRADELTEQIPLLKKQAVAKMKEGDKEGALALLKQAKAFEKELEEIMASVMPPEDDGDNGGDALP